MVPLITCYGHSTLNFWKAAKELAKASLSTNHNFAKRLGMNLCARLLYLTQAVISAVFSVFALPLSLCFANLRCVRYKETTSFTKLTSLAFRMILISPLAAIAPIGLGKKLIKF